jgi:hypothetical protein
MWRPSALIEGWEEVSLKSAPSIRLRSPVARSVRKTFKRYGPQSL